MKNLKKKLGGGNGFTLVEMLIVVAIIAILIAISIPLVNSALERAKHAADAANERAAKAQIVIENLGGATDIQNGFYDAASGKVVGQQTNALVGYGKHKEGADDHKDKVLHVMYTPSTGVVTMAWIAATETTKGPADTLESGSVLCTPKATP